MWQFCIVCRRAPLLWRCHHHTHRSVFVLSHFALQVLCESKIMKKIFSINELVRLGVSNLVEVFFFFLKSHIINHIHPSGTVDFTGETKLEGYFCITLPTPALIVTPPSSSVAKSDLAFAGGWVQMSESIDKFASNLKRHRYWVSKERNQLNLPYSCHGRVVSCLYPEFNSLENERQN